MITDNYFAFLRGINVGGHNIVRMTDLMEVFVSAGFSEVKTYIQSGNVSFCTSNSDPGELQRRIEILLKEKFGFYIPVMLRHHDHLRKLPFANPFGGLIDDTSVKLYVCFLEKAPAAPIDLPVKDEKEGLEMIAITPTEAFIVSREIKSRFGIPNNFTEKRLGINSTVRNLTTLMKMLGKEK